MASTNHDFSRYERGECRRAEDTVASAFDEELALIASFCMHELDWTRAAHDSLWSAVATRLADAGLSGLPATLIRNRDIRHIWHDPNLIVGTTCGYPYATELRGRVALVGAPAYRWPGCQGQSHRSFVVVRDDSPIEQLEDCRGARFAMNSRDSNTGMNLARALFAPFAGGRAFFSSITVTGAHLGSLDAVRGGQADLAAIDCVTYGLAQAHAPDAVAGTRIIAETPPSPTLPYVMNAALAERHGSLVRTALRDAVADPSLREATEALGLIDVAEVDDDDYEIILDYQRAAVELDYPELC